MSAVPAPRVLCVAEDEAELTMVASSTQGPLHTKGIGIQNENNLKAGALSMDLKNHPGLATGVGLIDSAYIPGLYTLLTQELEDTVHILIIVALSIGCTLALRQLLAWHSMHHQVLSLLVYYVVIDLEGQEEVRCTGTAILWSWEQDEGAMVGVRQGGVDL